MLRDKAMKTERDLKRQEEARKCDLKRKQDSSNMYSVSFHVLPQNVGDLKRKQDSSNMYSVSFHVLPQNVGAVIGKKTATTYAGLRLFQE